jgi:hypothetical protein
MKRLFLSLIALAWAGSGGLGLESANAQEAGAPAPPAATTSSKDWYYAESPQPETKTLGRQKAETRARERMARLNTLRWYGITPGRPTTAGMPFTSTARSAWPQAGSQTFAWNPRRRPVVVVSPYFPSYSY